MSLFKKGKTWHYDFIYKGKRHQGSTGQTNINKAKLTEAKVRSDAALETFGIGAPKTAPTLEVFLEGDFQKFVDRHAKARRTAKFYRERVKRLLAYEPWKGLRLTAIDGELIEKYCAFRSASLSINSDLGTLRKALRLAEEWKLIPKAPKVRLLPAPPGREFIVNGELETAYIDAAPYPLKQAAVLILDLGLRPEECVRLRKTDISCSILMVREGKSKNATRSLPLTDRAKCQIDELCDLWPESEWLFPGRKGRHYTRGALDNLHAKVRAEHNFPEGFLLYALRHTFATRCAESGASPFQIQRLMGHYDVRMSQRYVHPQADDLVRCMKQKELLDKAIRGEVHAETSAVESKN